LDSLERLGLDYIDLYLLHWPVANQTQSAWEDLEKLLDEGLVKSIGVSNFNDKQLETLFKQVNIRPMVNQIELHPYFSRPALVRFCSDRAVVVTAYCPLARGTIKKNQFFQKLGRKHEKTVSQIILRWHYQSGHVLIPKAANPQHIRENASIFDFSLSPDDMAAIGRQNQNRSVLKPPFHFDADGYIIE
jgi:diketogulonate reductase-like aldo/keto reductase